MLFGLRHLDPRINAELTKAYIKGLIKRVFATLAPFKLVGTNLDLIRDLYKENQKLFLKL